MYRPKRLTKTTRTRRHASELYYHEKYIDKGRSLDNLNKMRIDKIHDDAAYKVGVAALAGAASGALFGGPIPAGVGYALGTLTGVASECGVCHRP